MYELSDFSAALMRIRVMEVEGRIAKLVGAGVPLDRLSLGNNDECECHGTGILLKTTPTSILGSTCPNCLGVNMTIDRRTFA